jgi:hypothetical protein
MQTMRSRLNILGMVLAVFGLFFLAGGAVAYSQVQDGYTSLAKFSEAQNVTLSYNEDGQLIDRGEVEGAEAIMALLTEDWGYPVDMADLDPADPVVNTDSEYMFQMATIGYHILNGTQTVVLDEAVEYEGETFEAGTYEVPVDGRYWTGFDRMHPLDGPAREQAWSGTAHGLFAELGVGTVTHSALQMGLGIAALLGGLGGTLLVAGLGLVWATRGPKDEQVILMGDTAREEHTV